jgi:hypothetical protein
MGKLKSLGRKLNQERVDTAIKTFDTKRELALNFVRDRIERDKEFATDVLKMGDAVPKDIRELAKRAING